MQISSAHGADFSGSSEYACKIGRLAIESQSDCIE
jgi:hypothetical protein